MPPNLIREFDQFLRSFKNSESVSADLRAAISVDTGIRQAVLSAIESGTTVFLTGSAGSGKTHILHELTEEFKLPVVGARSEPPSGEHILLIADATELPADERVKAVAHIPPGRKAAVLAINEGPMREASCLDGGEIFRDGLRLLHKARKGIPVTYSNSLPTLIDAAGFNPIGGDFIAQLLATDIVQSYIEECINSEPEYSPRARALAQLRSAAVRSRVAEIVQLAQFSGRNWLFRDVWDLVADILIGGTDEDDPPTSPWFWRLFYGEADLAFALRSVVAPHALSVPFVEPRIFHGYWTASELQLVDDVEPIVLSQPDMLPGRFLLQKLQTLVLGKRIDLCERVRSAPSNDLWFSVVERNTSAVLGAINNYVVFGLRHESVTQLDLWVEHRVERRTSHNLGFIRIGEVPRRELEIVRSLVTANHPSGLPYLMGSNYFLTHAQTGAVFALDHDRVHRLQEGRSVRVADRSHADLDWDLHRFFGQMIVGKGWRESFEVFNVDLDYSALKRGAYAVSSDSLLIEED